jgi:carboxyl-terminal processing protease
MRLEAIVLAALLMGAGCSPQPAFAPLPRVVYAPVDSTLALAAFDSAWRVVRDSYYDSTMRGIDWAGVRDDLRPRAATASTFAELRAVIGAMLSRLGESHFAVISGDRASALEQGPGDGDGDVGLELRLMESRLAVFRLDSAGPAWRAGIRPGWALRAVEGVDADSVITSLAQALEATPKLLPFAAVRFFEGMLGGEAGTTVAAEFGDHTNTARTARIVRMPVRGQAVSFGLLPTSVARVQHWRVERGGRCVGVIRFSEWMAPIAAAIDSAVAAHADCVGIVLDLRGNPGGLAAMVMGLAGHFLEAPDSLGTLRMRGTTIHLVSNPRYRQSADGLVGPRGGRLAIVIDELSASTTEIFAGALQQLGRARIFGAASPGFALPARTTRLPGGDVLMYVVADFTLPRGGRVEGAGVRPDVEIAPSRSDLLSGRDPALESAVEWVETGLPTTGQHRSN